MPHILKKRDRIKSLVKKQSPRYLKRTHKFGIEVPKTVKEALELDKKNGDTLWADVIAKEMKDVCVAFKILPDGQSAPIGYQRIPCHMIFDVKMKDFRRKARLVAGGHRIEAPATITYASVVSRETVCIALLMAALITEKVWTVLGAEFGSDAGKSATPTYGIRLRPGLTTILGIMQTYCATLTTSSVCTMTQ